MSSTASTGPARAAVRRGRPRPLHRAGNRPCARGAPRALERARIGRDIHDRPADAAAAAHAPRRAGVSRILIAEDEARIASFLEKGLKANGFTTSVAADGRDAVALAPSGRYDLLILDLGLPGKDGFEVLDELRAAGSSLPVVILTARDSVQRHRRRARGGADDYIAKPFRFEELLARVRVRLRGDRVPEETVLRVGEAASRPAHTSHRDRRSERRPLRARVRARGDVLPPSRAGALPRAAPQPRLGLRLRSPARTSSTSTSATCARSWARKRSRASVGWGTGWSAPRRA